MRRLMLKNEISAIYPQKIIADKPCKNMTEVGNYLSQYAAKDAYTIFAYEKCQA